MEFPVLRVCFSYPHCHYRGIILYLNNRIAHRIRLIPVQYLSVLATWLCNGKQGRSRTPDRKETASVVEDIRLDNQNTLFPHRIGRSCNNVLLWLIAVHYHYRHPSGACHDEINRHLFQSRQQSPCTPGRCRSNPGNKKRKSHTALCSQKTAAGAIPFVCTATVSYARCRGPYYRAEYPGSGTGGIFLPQLWQPSLGGIKVLPEMRHTGNHRSVNNACGSGRSSSDSRDAGKNGRNSDRASNPDINRGGDNRRKHPTGRTRAHIDERPCA